MWDQGFHEEVDGLKSLGNIVLVQHTNTIEINIYIIFQETSDHNYSLLLFLELNRVFAIIVLWK